MRLRWSYSRIQYVAPDDGRADDILHIGYEHHILTDDDRRGIPTNETTACVSLSVRLNC